MERRIFGLGLGATVYELYFLAQAQQSGKFTRIGALGGDPTSDST